MDKKYPPGLSEHSDEARAWLAAIIESSDDAIVSKDLDGVITSWNQGAERVFGYTAEEAIGQPVMMLIPTERHDEEPSILSRIRSGQRIDHYETIRRRKDGSLINVSLSVSPILDTHGKVVGASKIARDMTERRRVEERLQAALRIAERAREEAETANRAKDEFLAMLGHELRNPLSAVRNAISAAILDDASRDRALEIARRQTDQLSRMVDDLLDVARITRGRVPLRKQRMSLAEVLQRATDSARPLMDDRGQTLTVTMRDPIDLDADPARIEQAVVNLLTNAAKYSPAGGTITMTATRENGDAVIRVKDRGIGIAPDILPHVFDLFSQGPRPLDRAQGGLGIGLTLVRRIVELHEGMVEAKSAGSGRGAEFILTLPALPATATESAESATIKHVRPRDRHPARVLIVEDNPDAADSLVIILELLGHTVRLVHDGPSAIEAARTNPPDVMLVDIGLPGMSGYEMARILRKDTSLKHVVLIALTGYGRPEDKAQAMASGFDYHLVKPVDLDALRDLVGKFGADEPPTPKEKLH